MVQAGVAGDAVLGLSRSATTGGRGQGGIAGFEPQRHLPLSSAAMEASLFAASRAAKSRSSFCTSADPRKRPEVGLGLGLGLGIG